MNSKFVIFVIFLLVLDLNLVKAKKLTPGEQYFEALKKLDFTKVKEDILKMFVDNKPQWPADYGNYAPFFIRLAWHCSGSYRIVDGRGSCDGARIRFQPERSWDDNTNLDKALTLLTPIKEKYGIGLSWGDLIILTGTMAIKSMGGPMLGFCAGRIDDNDGSDSIFLGPSQEQEALSPCAVNGQCQTPLGPTTIGLIYVNPEGPMGQPIPEESCKQIRDSFGRMDMNDTETVALIGGGHSFGKSHGACPLGPGKKPSEDPQHPWQGKCGGDGKGNNTFTSGFEGTWTQTPLQFTNYYFKNLLDFKWKSLIGPGNHTQWGIAGPLALEQKGGCPYKDFLQKLKATVGLKETLEQSPDLMMFTSDISLTKDPKYLEIVKTFANDKDLFTEQFSKAWYKLVTRDMGPVSRCYGNDIPPAQPFQNPLPQPSPSPDFWVKFLIKNVMRRSQAYLDADIVDNQPTYGGWFVKLAWQCASTFRRTDYTGGCNGARIRFSPQKDWPENNYMDKVLRVLEPVKINNPNISWADIIVLAGTVALEEASGVKYEFCGGRSDALDGSGSAFLNNMTYQNKLAQFKDKINLLNFNNREAVALQARMRGFKSQQANGYQGTWMQNGKWDNQYFKLLSEKNWKEISEKESKAEDMDVFMNNDDMFLRYDAPMFAIVEEFASDNNLFMNEFRDAWTKLMNADRFDGPVNNLCNKK